MKIFNYVVIADFATYVSAWNLRSSYRSILDLLTFPPLLLLRVDCAEQYSAAFLCAARVLRSLARPARVLRVRSDVWVGAHGDGLSWGIFMPHPAAIVEMVASPFFG